VADETTPTPTSEPTPNPAPSERRAMPPRRSSGSSRPCTKAGRGRRSLAPTALGNAIRTQARGRGRPAKAAVPETYELTVPEGFEKLDADAVAAATPVFKELGLSNEQANKLMPVAGEYAKRIVAERDQQFLGTILEQRKAWLEMPADKEIGGQNWDGRCAMPPASSTARLSQGLAACAMRSMRAASATTPN
jgi:hypothetical protein